MNAESTVRDALRNPIGTMVDETRRLQSADDSDFAREWLLRILKIELHRYSMEDSVIDTDSEIFKLAVAALAELSNGSDWIDARLNNYLVAVRRAAQLPQLPYDLNSRTVRVEGQEVKICERSSRTAHSFWISNTTAKHVPIMEESLGSPLEGGTVLDAFSKQLNQLKSELNLTGLCFIEKEMGPVGAISMLSSLVQSTGLPACIYRETHWTGDMSLAGVRPKGTDRLAIVYDLVVTGVGITGAADLVQKLSGAETVAAMVLCGYGTKRSFLESPAKQKIALHSLDWRTDVHGPAFEYVPSRDQHEARKIGSAPREEPGERDMTKNKSEGRGVPPGYYTRQTLPTISRSAQSIVDRIYAATGGKPAEPSGSKSARKAVGLLTLTDKGAVAHRLEKAHK